MMPFVYLLLALGAFWLFSPIIAIALFILISFLTLIFAVLFQVLPYVLLAVLVICIIASVKKSN